MDDRPEIYDSRELSEIGNSAPIDTLEETIESLAQKEITKVQLHYRERFNYFTGDEFASRYLTTMGDIPNLEVLFEAHINKNIQEIQNNAEFDIDNILQLRDYRTAGLHETYLD